VFERLRSSRHLAAIRLIAILTLREEPSQIHALDRTQPILPAALGAVSSGPNLWDHDGVEKRPALRLMLSAKL
jgi:hypothetical protein